MWRTCVHPEYSWDANLYVRAEITVGIFFEEKSRKLWGKWRRGSLQCSGVVQASQFSLFLEWMLTKCLPIYCFLSLIGTSKAYCVIFYKVNSNKKKMYVALIYLSFFLKKCVLVKTRRHT